MNSIGSKKDCDLGEQLKVYYQASGMKINRPHERDFEATINELKDLLKVDDLGINGMIHIWMPDFKLEQISLTTEGMLVSDERQGDEIDKC